MIDSNEFIERAKAYFSYLIQDFNFILINEVVRGNAFYLLEFSDKVKIVSVSYENIEDYFQVIIFMLSNGTKPDYDDKTKTLHLNKLNKVVLAKIDSSEIELNNEYFSKYKPKGQFERKLLKSAKELKLCLKYFSLINP